MYITKRIRAMYCEWVVLYYVFLFVSLIIVDVHVCITDNSVINMQSQAVIDGNLIVLYERINEDDNKSLPLFMICVFRDFYCYYDGLLLSQFLYWCTKNCI